MNFSRLAINPQLPCANIFVFIVQPTPFLSWGKKFSLSGARLATTFSQLIFTCRFISTPNKFVVRTQYLYVHQLHRTCYKFKAGRSWVEALKAKFSSIQKEKTQPFLITHACGQTRQPIPARF